MRARKIIKDYYVREPECQLDYTLKTEVSGFVPRSVLIHRMFLQGELDKAMNDFANNRLLDREDDLNKRIGLLNIKGVTRSELIRQLRSRTEEFNNGYNEYEKKMISLYDKLQGTKPLDPPAVTPPADVDTSI